MVVGHDRIIEDLKRLAKTGDLSHGYIFFGPAMVGKRSLALAFANFLERGERFGLTSAEAFAEQKFLTDGLLIEPGETGTIGIDAARQIKYFLWQRPTTSQYRTVVIDNAELMTAEAQNAILKIAEEPPQSALLILITSDLDGLLPTISSRLQKIYFPTISEKIIAGYIQKTFPQERAPEAIARRSFGKPGLASRLIGDKELAESLKTAENLLRIQGEHRRDFVKVMLKSDDFNLNKLLDAMIFVATSEVVKSFRVSPRQVSVDPRWWHKLLELRYNSAYFGLNPRLQLEALFV